MHEPLLTAIAQVLPFLTEDTRTQKFEFVLLFLPEPHFTVKEQQWERFLVGDKFGESLGGSRAPDFPGSSPEPATSPEVLYGTQGAPNYLPPPPESKIELWLPKSTVDSR